MWSFRHIPENFLHLIDRALQIAKLCRQACSAGTFNDQTLRGVKKFI